MRTGRYSVAYIAAISASLGIVAATPVTAAPIEQITCLDESFAPDVRAQMATDILAGIAKKKPARSAENDMYDAQIKDASAACRSRFGWTKAEEESAQLHFILTLMANAARAAPEMKGVDIAVLDPYAHTIARTSDPSKVMKQNAGEVLDVLTQSGVRDDKMEIVQFASLYLFAMSYRAQSMDAFTNGKSVPMWRP